MSKSHDGNASDNNVFRKRCEGIIKEFAASEMPRYLVADSKLYTQENAANLSHLPFITRIPGNLNAVDEVIEQSIALDNWQPLDDQTRYQRVDLCHYGIEQRWLVVYSENAYQRAGAQAREEEKVSKQLFHLQAQRFESEVAARQALEKIGQKFSYHKLDTIKLTQHVRYASRGKPEADSVKRIEWQISGTIVPDTARLAHRHPRFNRGLFCGGYEYTRYGTVGSGSDQRIQKSRCSRAWVQFPEVTSVLCIITVCEEAIPDRRFTDGDDPCIAGVFGGTATDAESVIHGRRDDSNPRLKPSGAGPD